MKNIALMVVFVLLFNTSFAEVFLMLDGTINEGTIIKQQDYQWIFIKTKQGDTKKLERKLVSRILVDKSEQENTPVKPEVEVISVTEQEFKMQQYNSFVALQEINKSLSRIDYDTHRLADSGQSIQSILTWEFGIAIGLGIITAGYFALRQ